MRVFRWLWTPHLPHVPPERRTQLPLSTQTTAPSRGDSTRLPNGRHASHNPCWRIGPGSQRCGRSLRVLRQRATRGPRLRGGGSARIVRALRAARRAGDTGSDGHPTRCGTGAGSAHGRLSPRQVAALPPTAVTLRSAENIPNTAGVTFEMCPTSSRCTAGWKGERWADHPAAFLHKLHLKADESAAARIPRATSEALPHPSP